MEHIYGLCLVLLQTYVASGGSSDGSIDPTSPCQPGETTLVPHQEFCQLYYDCSLETQTFDWLKPYQVECPYPDLFDTATMSCQHYNTVTCGDRKELVNGCEYLANQCWHGHCRECYLRYPECQGLPDGPNPIQAMLDSPFFAICQDGRFVEKLSCPKDERGRHTIFDSASNTCISA